MLEKLVHGSGSLPPNQHVVRIAIPNGMSYEMFSEAHLPGWGDFAPVVSKRFGEAWQQSKRSLLLIVPSVVARMERNILINPEHGEFSRITYGLHRPVWWDGRLFGSGMAYGASVGRPVAMEGSAHNTRSWCSAPRSLALCCSYGGCTDRVSGGRVG